MARRRAGDNKVTVGSVTGVSGEANIAGRDIVKNIKTIHQRALTAAEEATHGRKIEGKLLAQGVSLLAQNLSAQASQTTESDTPYKGLLAYNLNEAEIFFGRQEAKKDLLRSIKQDSLTVLHAESGAGKSSLLQAGIAAQLIANGHLAIRLRPHNDDPVDFIKRTFLPDLSQAPSLARAPLLEFLRQVCAVLGPQHNLYLLIDQFEEFFNLLKKDERKSFLESLADCLNDSSLKVRWVLALRAEALSDLAELESFGISPFKNIYRLNRLSRAEAREAIIEPAKRYGIKFESVLIDHILDSLETNREVAPTQLQLVCSALTDELPADQTLTLAYYTEKEGGTEGILRDHLKRQLENLPVEEQASAWKVLRALITADRQRAVKTYDEIIQELKISGLSKKQIDTVLGRLVERRLIFTQPATTETFELAHDYLVKEIELDPREQARKAAQELLDQEVRSYQRHKTLLTAERLRVIETHRNEIYFSPEGEILFIESQKSVQRERLTRERWRNAIFASLAVIAIAMALLASWAFQQRNEAQKQANLALARQLAAQAQYITATRSSKQMIAVLLATQSMKMVPSSETAQVLLNNNDAAPSIARMTHNGVVLSVAFSPDGKYVVAGSGDKTVRVWEAATGKEVARMTHDDEVTSVAFSPDGKYVVSGSDDKTARVWEATTGKEVARMTHATRVWAVAFSPDGKYVASGGCDYPAPNGLGWCPNGTTRVWKAATGKEVAHMTHAGWVTFVAFSPDGKYVASGSDDKTARVWEAATGKEIARMTHDDNVFSVAFSPDGKYVVSGSWDNTARVWEATTGKEVARMTHDSYVAAMAFSPDGKYVVSGSYDGTARVWEVATGKEIARMTHDSSVISVAFSPDGKYVVSGSDDKTARVWEATTGKDVARMTHDSSVTSVAFSPDGKYVVSGSYDGTARLWKATTGREVVHMTHAGWVTFVAFSPDGKYVVSGSADGTARIWEAATGKEVVHMTHNGYVRLVAFSPDGKYVVSGSWDHTARVWEAKTGKEIARMTHGAKVWAVAFSPDGKYVVSGGDDKTARVWEAKTGKEITRMTHGDYVFSVAFSPDGKYVVSGSNDGTARVWEAKTGKEIARMTHNSLVVSLAFSPDGKYVASGGGYEDKTARVWEAATGKEVARMTHAGRVWSWALAFSPDGKYVVSGNSDKTARVWEAATGKEVARMTHDAEVFSVAFSPDGKYVVSGGWDHTARVWEVATSKEIARIIHDARVWAVAFSPDGKYVVSGSDDHTARVSIWRPEDLIADACSRVTRNLTRAEWKEYVGDVYPYQVVCSSPPTEPESPLMHLGNTPIYLNNVIWMIVFGTGIFCVMPIFIGLGWIYWSKKRRK